MIDVLKRIEPEDYITLSDYLTKHPSHPTDRDYPEQLARIVDTNSLIAFMKDVGDQFVAFKVINECINSLIYLDYGQLLLTAIELGMSSLFQMLAMNGASYLVDANEVLRMLGDNPTDESVKMLQSFVRSLSIFFPDYSDEEEYSKQRPTVFIRTAEEVGYSQKLLFELNRRKLLISVLEGVIEEDTTDKIEPLIYSGIGLNEHSVQELRSKYEENQYVLDVLEWVGY